MINSVLGIEHEQRHQRLLQANIHLHQHPADAKITIDDLKEMVYSVGANQMVNKFQWWMSIRGTRYD